MSSHFDAEAAEDPIQLFGDWFRAACESEEQALSEKLTDET